jgi:hypothetical protein
MKRFYVKDFAQGFYTMVVLMVAVLTLFTGCGGGGGGGGNGIEIKNSAKNITSLEISGVPGSIAGTNISLTLPYGSDLTSLTPTVVITGANVSPASGAAQDFSSPVIYTVTAEDSSTKDYIVMVKEAFPSSKDITQFEISGFPGSIVGTDISITVPYGSDLTSLTPTVVITGASVSPESGEAQDFSSPVTYTVTAWDTSVKAYLVTVTIAPSHIISGTVNYGETGLSGVTLYLTGVAPATTDAGGVYNFTGLANGIYTVVPVLEGYTFDPVFAQIVVNGASVSSVDFVVDTGPTYSISGTVSGDVPLSDVTITLSGYAAQTIKATADGTYSVSGLVPGSYTVTPSLSGYTFSPDSTDVTVVDATMPDNNFVGTPVPAVFTQADLEGTWKINVLATGVMNAWMRETMTVNDDGVTHCVSHEDSFGGIDCGEDDPDSRLIIDPTTGVITPNDDPATHITMTSNKNFMAGTSGETESGVALLYIGQKVVPGTVYADSDLQSKSMVFHFLQGGYSSSWAYGLFTTDGSSNLSLESMTSPSGSTSGGSLGPVSLDANGTVLLPALTTFKGFMSDDKKTIVGTFTQDDGGDQISYSMMIWQVTGDTFAYTGGFLPDAIYAGHMISCGASSFWAHWTAAVASGVWTPGDWVDSLGGSAPDETTFSIDATGKVTNTAGKDYHGQMSRDRKFLVGTQTSGTGVYSLIVETR